MTPPTPDTPSTSTEAEAAAVWASVGDLTPDPRNPRDNTDAVEKVAASIKRFGFTSPIVARLADGMVIAGHTRLAAAKALGLGVVPVRFVDLDPADARLLNITDNRLGEIATWQVDGLGDLLRELDDEGLDLTVAGFTDAELDDLLREVGDGGGEGSGDPVAPPSLPIAGATTRHAAHLVNGECLATLREMPDNSVDAVITDAPYGLGFMASATKGWDAPDMAWAAAWAVECLRVLKPGGHLLCWSSDRTDHRIKVALEDAGFDIRRTFCWATFQGFPKSVAADLAIDRHLGALDRRPILGEAANYGQQSNNTFGEFKGKDGDRVWDVTGPATDEARRWWGYGTDVKPANEPAVLARKPLEGTLAANLLKWGTGALHIDAARHAPGDPMWLGPQGEATIAPHQTPGQALGRFPSSLVFAPKVGRKERNWGCEGLPPRRPPGKEGRLDGAPGMQTPRAGAGRQREGDRNFHPTLKPIGLSRWFVRLLAPGPSSVILDTFAGSGALVAAAVIEGHRAIGIEREGDKPDAATGSNGLGYFAILQARAAAALVVPLDALDFPPDTEADRAP